MNFLYKTYVYCIGHMEYANGEDWRQYVEEQLTPRNIVVFNPYRNNVFLSNKDESDNIRKQMRQNMLDGNYKPVEQWARNTARHDFDLCEKSDFIIAHIIPHIASWGSADELYRCADMRKPIFLSIEGGKQNTPLWLLSRIPSKYIYNNVEESIEMIKKIDDGKIEVDSKRWRLLRKDFR